MLREPGQTVTNALCSLDYRVIRGPPFNSRIVHHDVYEDGDQKSNNFCPILDLAPVNFAVPRGTSMHQLVPKYVEPLEQCRQNNFSVLVTESRLGTMLAP